MRHSPIFVLNSHSTPLGLIFLFLALPPLGLGPGDTSSDAPVKTNLEVIQAELAGMTKEIMGGSNVLSTQDLFVMVQNSDTSGVLRNTIFETLKGMAYNVFVLLPDANVKGVVLEMGLVETKVSYSPTFRDSFLGRRKTERTITTTISAHLRSTSSEVLFAGHLSRTLSDTVRVGEIPDLEIPVIDFTHGEPPRGGVIEDVLEPAVIIGASAVVIYLFFTVRS